MDGITFHISSANLNLLNPFLLISKCFHYYYDYWFLRRISLDEENFQLFFQKPCKTPIKKQSETFLRKELIEQHQENLIELEEKVPAYKIPNEKYMKVPTRRLRLKVNDDKNPKKSLTHSMKDRIGGWFKSKTSEKPGCLRGGADRCDQRYPLLTHEYWT